MEFLETFTNEVRNVVVHFLCAEMSLVVILADYQKGAANIARDAEMNI